MAYDITKLKSDLTGMLHGTTTNQITGLNNLIDRAARQLLMDVDPQETKRVIPLASQVFDNVFDYPCPVDLKGNAVFDLSPQVNRTPQDVFMQNYSQEFDIAKSNIYTNQPRINVNFNTSVKTLRIDATTLPAASILNPVSAVVGDGTWVVGTNATNIQTDNVVYVYGGGSVSFNLSAGATGYIENTTSQAVDIESMLSQGYLFMWVYLPVAANFTSVNLRWGSSSSAYYNLTVTQTQQQTAFQNGWNLLAFPWVSATTVGSPDPSAIDYLRVTFAYNGTAQTAVRVNYIASVMGFIYNLSYYSKYLFRDVTTGVYQETVTDDSNLINLDTETFNLLTYLVAYYAAQQQQGLSGLFYDANFFLTQYKTNLARYTNLYKSEKQLPQSTYYEKPNPNYSRFWPGWNQ